jgi:hypothetical protein
LERAYKKSDNHIGTFALVFCLSWALASSAVAQEKVVTRSDSVVTKQQAKSAKKDDVKMFLDKIEILGRIDKPQTVFIIPGKDGTIDDIMIDRSFFREIFRPVEKDDFRKRVEKAKPK